MPRHPRLFIHGATYHVYCRVARGEFVFNDPCATIQQRYEFYGWNLSFEELARRLNLPHVASATTSYQR